MRSASLGVIDTSMSLCSCPGLRVKKEEMVRDPFSRSILWSKGWKI